MILALSAGEKGISRDFAVLQIAHILAKHGKSVLIVDCDFLHAGLSGLVENVEEHGFLDLLLYGSSLKTVARPIGIEGVSVTGAGSFPVSRTIPFALKEFEKIREFLRAKHDVVIYCSTLYTEDAKINPLARLVDGIVLCCRIEDMSEGELQKNLKALGAEKVPPVELVCFCGKREQARGPRSAEKASRAEGGRADDRAPEEAPPRGRAARDSRDRENGGSRAARALEPEKKPRVSMLRVVIVAAAILIVAFVVWWAVINRTVREKEPRGTTTGAVARTAGDGRLGAGGFGGGRRREPRRGGARQRERPAPASETTEPAATPRDGAEGPPDRRRERRAKAPSGAGASTRSTSPRSRRCPAPRSRRRTSRRTDFRRGSSRSISRARNGSAFSSASTRRGRGVEGEARSSGTEQDRVCADRRGGDP